MVDAFECHNVYQFIGPESHYVSKGLFDDTFVGNVHENDLIFVLTVLESEDRYALKILSSQYSCGIIEVEKSEVDLKTFVLIT